MRKLVFAGLSALSLIAAPTGALARDRDDGRHGDWGRGGRGDWGRGDWGRGDWDRGYRGYSHHGDGDAVAAGVLGLVLGAAIGSALTSDSHHSQRYYGPPDPYGYGPPSGYYSQGYSNGYSSYGQCFRRELVWDRRTRQNIEVTHPYPC
jgi:hypothetical protein